MSTEPNKAKAKALLLRDAMRDAGNAGISAQAHAVLAIVIAEAWPKGSGWEATITLAELERRLSASKRSVKRWADELESAELVRRRPGRMQVSTRWTVLVGVHTRALEGAPVRPGGRVGDTQEGAPVRPAQEAGKNTNATTTTGDAEPSPPSRFQDTEPPTPEERRRLLEEARRRIRRPNDAHQHHRPTLTVSPEMRRRWERDDEQRRRTAQPPPDPERQQLRFGEDRDDSAAPRSPTLIHRDGH